MGLKIMQWNAKGLMANKIEFLNYLNKEKGDKTNLICIQETYLKGDKNIEVPNFTQQRKDRPSNKGGLLTLIKNNIEFKQIPTPLDIEAIGTQIITNQKAINIFNVYIPPSKETFEKQLDEIFQHSNIILTGDLNAHHPLWNSPHPNKRGNILENLMEKYDCVLLNTGQPTFQTHKGARSTLDITIVSKNLALNSNWFTLNNTLGSDHQPTIITIDQKAKTSKRKPKWQLKKSRLEKIP